MNTSKLLKDLRLEHKLTQAKFSQLLGVTQAYVSSVESGKKNISVESLVKHFKSFGKNIKITTGE